MASEIVERVSDAIMTASSATYDQAQAAIDAVREFDRNNIIGALRDANAGGLTRVHIEGQTWVRHDGGSPEDALAKARLKIGELTAKVDAFEHALRSIATYTAPEPDEDDFHVCIGIARRAINHSE